MLHFDTAVCRHQTLPFFRSLSSGMNRSFFRFSASLLALALLSFQPAHASTLLIDLESNQTLLEEAPNAPTFAEPMLPLMAVYTALDFAKTSKFDLFENVPNPWFGKTQQKKGDVKPPQTVELAAILQIALMNGSKEAVEAIAPSLKLSDEEFTNRMRMTAEKLGMSSSQFSYPCGSSAPCIASAQDIARLAQALFRDFSISRVWAAQQHFDAAGLPPHATSNFLLARSPAISGIFVSPEEQNASAVVLSENPRNSGNRIRRLLAVELNSLNKKALRDRLSSLFMRAWRDYETLRVYEKGTVVAQIPVYKGNSAYVGASLQEDLFATLSREQMISSGSEAFDIRVSYSSPLVAPVAQGDLIAELMIYSDGREIAHAPLTAAETVPIGHFWTRFRDTLRIALDRDSLHP